MNRFLLASLHIDRLVECNHVEQMFRYLDRVPMEVDQLYDEAWNRATSDLGSHGSDLTKEVVMWILQAERVLFIEALGEMLMAAGLGSCVDSVTEQEILSACAGLIRTESLATRSTRMRNWDDEEAVAAPQALDRVVTFSHPSVYRYFRARKESLFPFADDHIVTRCLANSTPAEILSAVPGTHLAIRW